MILGIGIDVVDVSSFREILNEPTSNFVKCHFTRKEVEYCTGHKGHDPVLHYAGYHAAKEAFIKACGPLYQQNQEGAGTNPDYRDFEITTDKISGPEMSLSGESKERLAKFGIKKIFVSISHEAKTAAAVVILKG